MICTDSIKNALLVGGLNNVANAQSPVAVADSDASGNLTAANNATQLALANASRDLRTAQPW